MIKIVKTTKITLTLPDGKEIQVDEEYAKKLHKELCKHFGKGILVDLEKLREDGKNIPYISPKNPWPNSPMVPKWPTFPGDPINPYRPIYCSTDKIKLKDVHTEHCCSDHGCKYGDNDCTVTTGKANQSFPCMDCDLEKNN
jgi:hypothetical protein